MNRFVIHLFASALDHYARKGKVVAMERMIALIIRLFEKQPEQWIDALYLFSTDTRWILRYLAGREIGRLIVHDQGEAASIAMRLAGDSSLYVREGIAKGIVQSAEARFDQIWQFWQKAFDDSSDEVRQTAAMTLIALLNMPEIKMKLLPEAEKIRHDGSVKVKAIFENYVAPILEEQSSAVEQRSGYATTAEVPVPEKIIDQVVGQDEAVTIIRLAASQKRSVLLIGEPGTGKSMLGQAMAELLHGSRLTDVVVEAGVKERNVPSIRLLPAGEGERVIKEYEQSHRSNAASLRWILGFAAFVCLFVAVFYSLTRDNPVYMMSGLFILLILFWFGKTLKVTPSNKTPKYLINNSGKENPPFIDATGLHAGALLGDVRHDPYQSGGMETSPHHLVEPGAIHLAHQGVLYIDEVSTLSLESQQALLTAFQEKKMAITGRTPGSSGRMIRTEPVPSDFILVLAGNMQDVEKIHPALRSRIRGYGYEVYLKDTMPDTAENRFKLFQFVAQEVHRDGKIPHFTSAAVNEVIRQASHKADRAGYLSSRFRELGGLIRAAGDIAVQSGSALVHKDHILKALNISMPLEEQIGLREYEGLELLRAGSCCGRVKALASNQEAFGTMVQCWTDFQPSKAVEIKTSGEGSGNPDVSPIEAALNRFQLPGKYFIEVEGAKLNDSFKHFSLAIALSALSAAHKSILPENLAVCGSINVLGLVKESRYFDRTIAAAQHLGIRTLIAPIGNRRAELPGGIQFIWVHSFDEAWHAVQSQSAALALPIKEAAAQPVEQSVSRGHSMTDIPRTDFSFSKQDKAAVYRAIEQRRDIRSFKPDPVPDELLKRLLTAAHHAPSVGYMQPWNFIVIKSDETKQKLKDVADKERRALMVHYEGEKANKFSKLKIEGLTEAPITLCVTLDPTRGGPHVFGRNSIPETDLASVSCAIQNLWLAARAEGLAAGWVSFYKKQDVRGVLDIPPHVDPVALISIGYTDEFPDQPILQKENWRKRIPLEELIYSEFWGKEG